MSAVAVETIIPRSSGERPVSTPPDNGQDTAAHGPELPFISSAAQGRIEPILTDAAPIMFRHDGRIADFRPKGILLAQELRSGPTRYSEVAAGFRTIC